MDCTVSAGLLHYFLLALFCWMLCEGVLLYIVIGKAAISGVEDKVKYFYMFGWGKFTFWYFSLDNQVLNLKKAEQAEDCSSNRQSHVFIFWPKRY